MAIQTVIAIVQQVPKTMMTIYRATVMVQQNVEIAIKPSPLEICLKTHHFTNFSVKETIHSILEMKNHKRSA